MQLSELPELREYRNELAGKIHKKRGGDHAAALEAANVTARRIYGAALRHADSRKPGKGVTDRDISESVRRVLAEVRRTVGVTEVVARGPKPKKRKDAAISGAVEAAVDRVVAEAMNGKLRPGPGSGSAAADAPDTRPLAELTNDELTTRLGEAMLRTGQPQRVTETAQPEPPGSAIYDVDLTGDPKALQGLRDDDFLDFLGGAFIADGEQRLTSPLFGSRNPLSPFMQGLADG